MEPKPFHPQAADVSFDGGDLDCGNGLLLLIRKHIDPLPRGGLLVGMHRDTGLDMAHMEPMFATGDKQGLLQQFHLVLCSSLSGFQLQRLSRQASAPSRQSTPSRS